MRSITTGTLLSENTVQPAKPLAVPRRPLPRHPRQLWPALAAWIEAHPLPGGLCIFATTLIGLTIYISLLDRLMPTTDDWAIYWPFNGIAIGFLLLIERRYWPWVISGFVFAAVWHELGPSEPVAEVAIDVLADFTEVMIAACALPAFRGLRRWMMEPRLVLRFTLWAIFVGPLLGSIIVGLYFDHTHHGGFWHHMERWAFADALGTVLWTPLILILFSRETYDLFRLRALPATLGLLGTLYAVTWYTFANGHYPISFLPYPFLLFVAMRLGFSGAVLGANMLTLISTYLSLHGYGPFIIPFHQWDDGQTTLLRIFATLAMLFVFPLCVVLMERQNFQERLQQAYTDMKHLANVDGLTGVANRRHFDVALEAEWTRALNEKTTLSLLMIDADNFKAYNDRYGHLAGDECLRRIAAVLTGTLRPHDLVARYGGEEFAVLLPNVSASTAERIAQQMRTGIALADLPHEGNPFGYVTVSLGAASLVPGEELTPQELIAAADGALYLAKKSGRNRVHSAESS